MILRMLLVWPRCVCWEYAEAPHRNTIPKPSRSSAKRTTLAQSIRYGRGLRHRERRRIVDLEKELEQSAIGGLRGIEVDLDCLGMGAVIAICRIRHVATCIPDPGRDHAGQLADEVLHAPKAATGENSTFGRH